MKRILESLAEVFVPPLGAVVTPRTRATEFLPLIRSLRPVMTEHELIRLGPEADGGYLVPDDLTGISTCFSPGVDQVSGFELHCAERGMDVFMADRSVDGPAVSHPRFKFEKKFVGATNSSDVMTLDAWVNKADVKGDLILQMDIEGAEYETIYAASDDVLLRFRVIVMEFHNLHMLLSRPFFQLVRPAFAKLLRTHTCVHIHPNNASRSVSGFGIEVARTAEFTFLRSDRIFHREFATRFPHPLDQDNVELKPLPLGKGWYSD